MFIKSIVLDGFKSYGNRVEVTGFDPEFNAITGLNGTGKSNILDSICFVLGITNLSNVRAGSLQELIYKHGQAGITKATVSITFDNRDKRQCPIGYENHDEITVTRQVVMGGKNKYLINGINVQNKRVSDLFCSVQLNVNNPHFLIMQGRITKVLNMKPPEILSMVEEAAGTRMYEAKKQAAQKTIEKKDAKLREINDIIREDIAPKLQKLQDERAQFQEYQKVVRELDNLTRLHVAWKYVSAEERAQEAAGKVTAVEDDIAAKKEEINNHEKEAKELEQQVADMNKKLEEEAGGALAALQAQLAASEQEEAARGAARRAARDAGAAQARRRRLLQRALADDSAALAEKTAQLEQMSQSFEAERVAGEAAAAALAAAQQRFLAVSAGKEDASSSLQDQLIAAKQEAAEASTRVSQSGMERRHGAERLRALRTEFAGRRGSHARDSAALAALTDDVQRLTAELENLSFSSERLPAAQARARQLAGELRARRDAADTLAARLQRCSFNYSAPEANFDHSRVAGTVCRLFDVRDPLYCTALETAAGGRLYNVVVDTEQTSKLLLQRGRLATRATLIPLNKITPHVIDRHTLRLAQEIGGGPDKVHLALDLISFEERLRPALAWVFGGTLVCADLDAARRVTFDPRVRRRCVTLDGDVFDPSGTLSGGARAKGGSVLVQLSELRALESELSSLEQQRADAAAELAAAQAAADQHAALQQKLDMSQHKLQVARERVAATATAQLHDEIQALEKRVEELTAAAARDEQLASEATARARELEDKLKDIKGHREREFKKAEAALSAAKAAAAAHGETSAARAQEHEALRLEVDELRAAAAASAAHLADDERVAADLQRQLDDAAAEHDQAVEAVKQLQAQLKRQKAEMASRSGDISRLLQQKERLGAAVNDLRLQIKQLEYNVTELRTEAANCDQKMRSLEAEHAWISSERQYFGAAGGLYDFSGRQASVAGARLQQLRERRDRLSRGLNARAHTLLGKEEEQYQDVLRKKKIVEADRAKLVQVMAELDDKKRRTLVSACQQVNKDFGSIFSTLLPGAQARLTPPPGLTVLDGLEVKVGFNSSWKESLGELSGGQRSLVALSLVLAMLLFKPAPLYILDEVDAALDLSHTQNIGQMLKDHFKHSQFIIVSLKDGMFNNANVLFRTRFVDGMSSVQRTVNARR